MTSGLPNLNQQEFSDASAAPWTVLGDGEMHRCGLNLPSRWGDEADTWKHLKIARGSTTSLSKCGSD